MRSTLITPTPIDRPRYAIKALVLRPVTLGKYGHNIMLKIVDTNCPIKYGRDILSLHLTDSVAIGNMVGLVAGDVIAIFGVTWHGWRRCRWLKADAKTAVVNLPHHENLEPQK